MGLSLVAALSLSACRHPGPTTADPTLGTGKGVAKGTGKGAKKLGPANPAAGTATAANRPPNSSDPPPMKKFSELIKKAAGVAKGSGEPHTKKVGKLTQAQIREIAQTKLEDLNAHDVEQAAKIIAGTARSMGITVE